jgi:hypothetical protein
MYAEFALASVLGVTDVEQRQLAKLARKMVRVVKTSEGLPLNVPGMGLWRSNMARRALERYALDCVRRERYGSGAPADDRGNKTAPEAAGDDKDKREEAERILEMSVLRTMAHVTDEVTGELLPEEVVASELVNMLVHTLGNCTIPLCECNMSTSLDALVLTASEVKQHSSRSG